METITIRIPEEELESIDGEAGEYDQTRSEYLRELIRKGREYDDLERDRDRLEQQLGQLIEQREQSEELAQYVEEERTYRNQPIWVRAKWWVLGADA